MNLYLDDNMNSPLLAVLLRRAGHEVIPPSDAGTAGIADARHFIHALHHALVVLTRDHQDFEDLHWVVRASHGQHPGILAVRMENDSKRDMKDRDIVRA